MSEQWWPVVGAEGYEVSDHGRVRSVDRVIRQRGRYGMYERRMRGRVQAPWPTGKLGYLQVNLGGGARRYVHQLVCETWHGPRPEGMQVRHLDGDLLNNTPGNVLWGTDSDNKQDMLRHGRHYLVNRTHCPQRHRLIAPNLRATERACLACVKARNAIRSARRAGRPVPDLQAESDRCYAEIMGAAA